MMGWTLSFNKSVGIEARNERITGIRERSRVAKCCAAAGSCGGWGGLSDARDPGRVRHPLASLLRTAMLLVAQGRRDHNDAAAFGSDPAFRLAVSGRAGTAPLDKGGGRWRRSPRCRGWSRRCRGRGTWACSARGWPGSRGGGCGR